MNKSLKNIILLVGEFLEKKQILFLYSLQMIKFIITLALTYLIGKFIDVLFTKSPIGLMIIFLITLFILNILQSIIEYIYMSFYIKYQSKSALELYLKATEIIQTASISYIENQDVPYLCERINNDANDITIFYINFFGNFSQNILIVFITFFMIFNINFYILPIVLIIYVIFKYLYKKFEKMIYSINLEYREVQAMYFSKMQRQLSDVEVVKIFNLFDKYRDSLKKSFIQFKDKSLQNLNIQFGYSFCTDFLILVVQIIVYVYSGLKIISGEMSVGTFVILTSYFNMLIQSSNYFINIKKSIIETSVSYDRIKKILDLKKERNGDLILDEIITVEIEGLKFSYPEKQIFNGLNISLEKGNIYVISGENGVGKTTLIKIMIGLYSDVYSGVIKINGIDMNEIDVYKLRENCIGYVSQNLIIEDEGFLDTLDTTHMNIKEINDKIMEKFNICDFINFENKFDNFSGGEKQKILLAKEFIKKPDLLILDEPTSFLDESSKQGLMNLIYETKEDRITVIVTHDEKFKEIADRDIELLKID